MLNELPENIKRIREKWKMTQEEFAVLMDSKRARISHYENGNNDPDLFFMLRLQDFAQISIADLCRKKLEMQEIIENPSQEKLSSVADSLQGYYSEEDYLYLPFLVEQLKELQKRVDRLETQIGNLKMKI